MIFQGTNGFGIARDNCNLHLAAALPDITEVCMEWLDETDMITITVIVQLLYHRYDISNHSLVLRFVRAFRRRLNVKLDDVLQRNMFITDFARHLNISSV